ncbi:MAG: response regulator [Butyrivibrio sp.]
MSNILLVSESKSFIAASLVQQIGELGHNITDVGHDMSLMGAERENIQSLLILAEENLVGDMKMLVYMKDMVIEKNIPVFIAGEQEHIDAIKEIIPEQFIKKRFLRPINVKEVVEEINNFLVNDTSHMKKKILVVDDSGAMLRNVKGWLEDKYQVILANSGTMAITYLAKNCPDLILLDYEMPVCNGKQVLEMIRSEPEYANIPVIFLTGKNYRESVLSVSALKPEGYLLKTMEPSKIVEAVDNFFEKKKCSL